MYSEWATLKTWALLPTTQPLAQLLGEPEVQDFMRALEDLPPAQQAEWLTELAELLPTLNLEPAAVLAVCCGAMVEDGADPEAAFPALWARFEQLRARVAEGEEVPAAAWKFTVMGLMTMLCRSVRNRQQLRAAPGLDTWLEAHEALSGHLYFLAGVWAGSDEPSLYVLLPEHGTGLEISISQLNNTFHLLTLLQPLLVAHSQALGLPPLRPAPATTTHNNNDNDDTIYAQFGWLNALAYEGGPLNPVQMAWGEATVRDLPQVDGRVVLLASTSAKNPSRSWNDGFCALLHDAQEPRVDFRHLLSAAEVAATLAAIHPPVAAPTPSDTASTATTTLADPSAKRPWWQWLGK